MPGYEIYGSKAFLAGMESVVKMLSSSQITLLIAGETGTGKSHLAKHIASKTERYSGKYTLVSLGGLPPSLLESQLFGHCKGSFTGAHRDFDGRIMAADQGTVILDDISCLPVHLQVKLLRLLDDGEFDRIGDTKTYKADVRFIVTSNDDLPTLVKQGKFRKDLYYRINSFVLPLKPLRHKDRTADIVPLVKHFVTKYGTKIGKEDMEIDKYAVVRLQKFSPHIARTPPKRLFRGRFPVLIAFVAT